MTQNITSWITTVSVILAVLTLRASQRQRLRQFETLYVQRYWSLNDKLSLAALRDQPQTSVEPSDELTVRAYLRLCEDELELRLAGWISTATWKIWAAGMDAQLRRWPFSAVWQNVQKQQEQDFTLLRRFEEDPTWDPCQLSWFRSQVAGIGGPRSI